MLMSWGWLEMYLLPACLINFEVSAYLAAHFLEDWLSWKQKIRQRFMTIKQKKGQYQTFCLFLFLLPSADFRGRDRAYAGKKSQSSEDVYSTVMVAYKAIAKLTLNHLGQVEPMEEGLQLHESLEAQQNTGGYSPHQYCPESP